MAESNRVYITKEAIRTAFLKLLKTHRLERIRVVDLLKEARVGKTTFYRYYRDTYDVLNDCFLTYLGMPDEDALASVADSFELNYEVTLAGARRVQKYPELYLLCVQCAYAPFSRNFEETVILPSIESGIALMRSMDIDERNTPIDMETLSRMLVNFSSTILVSWINDGCREAPEEIASKTTQCTRLFINSLRNAPGTE